MDPSTYHDLWVNLATNSPFLGWMIYSWFQTNKALETTRKEQKEEREKLQAEHKADEQKIREKFEKVVEQLNQDRKLLVEGFSGRIDSLERGQKKLFAILEPIKEQIVELRIKQQISSTIKEQV
jgi:signal recognition particle GTPase